MTVWPGHARIASARLDSSWGSMPRQRGSFAEMGDGRGRGRADPCRRTERAGNNGAGQGAEPVRPIGNTKTLAAARNPVHPS
jgi:hypothetical protein